MSIHEYVDLHTLRIARPLYDLVRLEVAPGTGLDPDKVWASFAEIIEDLQSALEELQAISDDLAQTPGAREGED